MPSTFLVTLFSLTCGILTTVTVEALSLSRDEQLLKNVKVQLANGAGISVTNTSHVHTVGTVSRLRAAAQGTRDSSPQHPDHMEPTQWVPEAIPPEYIGREAKLTTQLHSIMTSLKISGAIPPLSHTLYWHGAKFWIAK
jgi:hypothetical protein